MRWFAIAVLACGCWTSSQQPGRTPVATDAPPVPAVREERFDQLTPRRALRSFLRAIELERYDVVMRFVPGKYREHMTEAKLREKLELESTRETLARLRQYRDAVIEETGDEARMTYGDGLEVRFVREEGIWRIEDLD